MSDRLCPICGGPLGRNKKACSHKCYSALRQHMRDCVVCGTPFKCPRSTPNRTCSEACSKEHRAKLAASGQIGDLHKAREIGAAHPLIGPYETHMHAKEWVIQAPDGTIYKCRNLRLWLREHEDLLDGTVSQAWDGITKIKYSMQGKRKHPSHQWKGWRLIEWGD